MANPDSRGAILGAIFLALSCAGIASSQPLEVVERDAGGQVTLRAVRIDEPLVVDGVLDESVYRLVPSVSGFIQQDPHEGEPATEDTEMWVLFDDDNIYVAARCWDSRPELIVANEMRRDNTGLYDNDNFAVLFDTFHDRRNAFIFHINPLGGLLDAQLFDENLFNRDWNTVWDAKTSRFDEGWTAEIVVPFKSLRYRGGGPQVWGINARRIVRSKNEFTHITLIPASYGTQGILKVSSAATLVGLETPERSQNIEIKPYARGDVTTNLEAEPPVTDQVDGDVGVDLKYGVTRGMTFDFTYNTDFAQVEVDEQQINLDRFQLFFPEKRPFFLENAGLFSVGNTGEAELFFSRRIGLGPDGTEIPIVAGARVSGRVGGTSVGFLNMQTEEVAGLAPANNFTVGRVQRELPNRSALGVIVTNRQGTGSLAGEDDYNRALGIDGRLGYGRNGLISGWAARTETPGREGNEFAYKIGIRHALQRIQAEVNYADLGESFNPELGFLSRRALRKADTLIFTRFRPGDFLGLQEIRPHVSGRMYWDRNGFQQTGHWHIDSHWEWRAGHQVHTGMNVTREGLLQPFEIYPGVIVPPGTYDHAEAQIVAFT
ncbi:MAG: DUF5916 domain-containing protein, partial [Vicinamibacteria bacterium]